MNSLSCCATACCCQLGNNQFLASLGQKSMQRRANLSNYWAYRNISPSDRRAQSGILVGFCAANQLFASFWRATEAARRNAISRSPASRVVWQARFCGFVSLCASESAAACSVLVCVCMCVFDRLEMAPVDCRLLLACSLWRAKHVSWPQLVHASLASFMDCALCVCVCVQYCRVQSANCRLQYTSNATRRAIAALESSERHSRR